jgi:hypothetical protein
MKRILGGLLALGLAGVLEVASVHLRAEEKDAQTEVLAAEKARTAALEGADVPALEKLLGDDLTYVHASGRTDTKQSYLTSIQSGDLHYISWKEKALHVRTMGETAGVIDGEYLVQVLDRRVKPDPFDVNIFFLGVYAHRNGRWQLMAWESTRDVKLSPLP